MRAMINEMIHAFAESKLFEPWIDPVSGIKSYILTHQEAPLQQSFYFTNQSFSGDGRYLWFYAAHPPAGSGEIGRTLGVADLEQETITWCPETQFRDGSPFVDKDSGAVYWCWGYSVFRREPSPDAVAVLVNSVPEEIHRHRYGKRLATHLTLSADGKEFFIDAHFGNEWCTGSMPLDGGDFVTWQTFDRCYNHAQFSPTDPDLALIAQDWWIDVATGQHNNFDNRIWVIQRGKKARAVFNHANSIAHEWWDAAGKHIWYVDYNRGTEKVDIVNSNRTSVWPNGTCHSHSSSCGRFLVGDIGTYSWKETGCRVAFYNIKTGREVDIASSLPVPPLPRGSYHIDPHPQFCVDDSVIVYTTTVHGRVAVALTSTKDLIDATS
jgi:hypothetical protein